MVSWVHRVAMVAQDHRAALVERRRITQAAAVVHMAGTQVLALHFLEEREALAVEVEAQEMRLRQSQAPPIRVAVAVADA
jgi:hypothetical protein